MRRLRIVVDLLVSNMDKHTKEGEVKVRLCNYVDLYKNLRTTANKGFRMATASQDEVQRFQLRRHEVILPRYLEDTPILAFRLC
jgi:type I restriction enzyme S subunit